MIKTILVLADDTPTIDATLLSAIELGRRFEAHLDVLHVRSDPTSLIPLAGGELPAPIIEEVSNTVEQTEEERASKVRAAYDRLCGQAGVSSSLHVATGWKPDIAAAAGRPRDLIVVGPPEDLADAMWKSTVNALLFDSGRPVLLLQAVPMPLFGESVALAWNGSAQAAHAAAAALPFFRLAKRTDVLTAGAIDPYASTAELVTCLARHGIGAVPRVFEPSYVPIGQALLEQSRLVNSTLLVMGAYSHSRLREVILGGATREVLSIANMPVLMVH
jgi:nucleotide-binding universal stress UspA family protein